MTLPVNPYQFSNPVYRKGEFFDRQFAATRLRRALTAQRSVQLVGQFRIGKSSLLRYVQEYLPEFVDDDQAVAIYYDLFRRPQLQNGNDFFARIWQVMSNTLVKRGHQEAALSPKLDLTDPVEFEEFLERWIEKEGYQFVFLLDEFGLIAGNENFDWNFFDNLRSTAALSGLTFVVAASRSLLDYAHKQVISSPLWNELELIRVTLFEDRRLIQELIHKPVDLIGLPWPDEAENFIYERGGQHPCYIQMAACALYDTYDQGDLNYRQAERIFSDTAVEHFRYLWLKTLKNRYAPEQEDLLRTALLDLIHGRRIDDYLAEELETHSLVWRSNVANQWEPFSVWFADWLRRWSTDKRIKTEIESHRLREKAEDKPSQSLLSGPNLQEGRLLEGLYSVGKIIAITKHNQVARAYDKKLQRQVTIKCPRLEQGIDDADQRLDAVQRLRENLERGARILAGLNHRNVGIVYQVLLEPVGVVMEWIEGLSFQDIVDSGKIMSANDVIEIGLKLSDALSYVHKKGIVHRDIKPGNIILNKDRGPVLIDFDIARASTLDTITRLDDGSFGYIGTKEYSAPEQFLDPEGVGAPTDMFSLGSVLYQLLTGGLPYGYGNLPSLYVSGFPELEKCNIPEPLYQVLCELLSEYPDQRPDAAMLKEKLQDCLNLQKQSAIPH